MIGFIIGFILGCWFCVMVGAAVILSMGYDKRHKDVDNDTIPGEGWETDV